MTLRQLKMRESLSVGVSWSWKGRSYLEQYNPDHLIDDMLDLLPIVGLTSDVDAV